MTAYVHLPEPVLRVDVALRAEQVLVGVGVDLRDAVAVALDVDRSRTGPSSVIEPVVCGKEARTVSTLQYAP